MATHGVSLVTILLTYSAFVSQTNRYIQGELGFTYGTKMERDGRREIDYWIEGLV